MFQIRRVLDSRELQILRIKEKFTVAFKNRYIAISMLQKGPFVVIMLLVEIIGDLDVVFIRVSMLIIPIRFLQIKILLCLKSCVNIKFDRFT